MRFTMQFGKPLYSLWFILLLAFAASPVVHADDSAQAIKTSIKKLAERNANNGPALDRFEAEIRAFEEADRRKTPPAACAVFVGSSTFTRWSSLENDFRSFNAVNRGFGGSTLPEINHYVPRIVSKYNPNKVVLYAGTNDIAELKHSGEQVFEDFKEFVKRVKEKSPKAEIFFISMSMAPSRSAWAKQFDLGNEKIRSYIETQSNLHYIDLLPLMRHKDGSLRVELFGSDRLHMNSQGYALWIPIIRKELQSVDASKH